MGSFTGKLHKYLTSRLSESKPSEGKKPSVTKKKEEKKK
ncbi:hypothetical protein CPT_Moonbeam174 [Bacillus phage Moonbeam]|uniref:Uncharacterized protein n=1 Tax=Bacillus phage Moonbeam TaxID=1540091 RepID=A0A0A0RNI5_9CAUD|nr:hypothetical protein CPT_Moonbeam174 [Bacillus phage Moonbeam]AIW03572.1 hypothetical protein CPT_Moonbeam174 [Bacillus phage Moonbeam]